jgi:hypothetical protein
LHWLESRRGRHGQRAIRPGSAPPWSGRRLGTHRKCSVFGKARPKLLTNVSSEWVYRMRNMGTQLSAHISSRAYEERAGERGKERGERGRTSSFKMPNRATRSLSSNIPSSQKRDTAGVTASCSRHPARCHRPLCLTSFLFCSLSLILLLLEFFREFAKICAKTVSSFS